MKFLMISENGRNAFLLRKLQFEGHEVLLLSKERAPDTVPVVYDPESALQWEPEVVLFDSPGAGSLAKHFQDNKVPIMGGSLLHDTLHLDPDYIQTLASRVRVPVIPLDNGGLKLRLAGFYSKKKFIGPAYSYVQTRGLFSGSTEGPVETMRMHAIPEEHPIIQKTFGKLERLFTAFHLAGLVTLDIEIDPEDGNPNIHALSTQVPEGFWASWLAGLEGELGKVLHGIASGKKFSVKYTQNIASAAKVSVPPYPVIDFPWLPEDEQSIVRERVLRGAQGIHVKEHETQNQIFWLNVKKNGTGNSYETVGPEVAYIATSCPLLQFSQVMKEEVLKMELPKAQYRAGNDQTQLKNSLIFFEMWDKEEDVSEFNREYGSRFRGGHYRNQEEPVPKAKPKSKKKKKVTKKKKKVAAK